MDRIDYRGFQFAKPDKRERTKRRADRQESDRTKKTRTYVFARERDICRCCRCRPAQSLHELIFRSRGGRVSRYNSVAVCGDGVTQCHGHLQSHRIDVVQTMEGAEGRLIFCPKTQQAADWLKIALGEVIISDPMVQIEAEA